MDCSGNIENYEGKGSSNQPLYGHQTTRERGDEIEFVREGAGDQNIKSIQGDDHLKQANVETEGEAVQTATKDYKGERDLESK